MTTAKRSPMEILFAPFRTPIGKKGFFIAGFSYLIFIVSSLIRPQFTTDNWKTYFLSATVYMG
jgi:hypothetical protein